MEHGRSLTACNALLLRKKPSFVHSCQKNKSAFGINREKRILRDGGKRFIISMKTFTHNNASQKREVLQMTISDIAKMAGVSSAAVSRYLN